MDIAAAPSLFIELHWLLLPLCAVWPSLLPSFLCPQSSFFSFLQLPPLKSFVANYTGNDSPYLHSQMFTSNSLLPVPLSCLESALIPPRFSPFFTLSMTVFMSLIGNACSVLSSISCDTVQVGVTHSACSYLQTILDKEMKKGLTFPYHVICILNE